jgi:DNA-binding MarR family transcriptional regulator
MVPDRSLGYLVNRAARLMAQALARRLERHGVAIGQWAVLLFLYQRDGPSQAELSRSVAIEAPTMVRSIDRMVRDGLVERRPDPADARVSRIYLTPKAIALRDSLFSEAQAVNAQVESLLGHDETERLKDLLRAVIHGFPADPGGSDRDR